VVLLGVELARLAPLHQLAGIQEGCRPVKTLPEGFTDQTAVRGMIPTHTLVDIREQFAPLFPTNTPKKDTVGASAV
jgi:hypothetical protein